MQRKAGHFFAKNERGSGVADDGGVHAGFQRSFCGGKKARHIRVGG